MASSLDSADQKKFRNQRKVLPSKPSTNVNSRMSMSVKMVERPSETVSRGSRQYGQFILEYAIMAELAKIERDPVPGVYMTVSDKDPLKWHGVLFVREGLYKGGVFRFNLMFPSTFPDGDCPSVVFINKIFHPAICIGTGDLNVAAAFPKWKSTVNHVGQVLRYVNEVFAKPDDSHTALNEEAATMFMNDPDAFTEQAKQCAERSRDIIGLQDTSDDTTSFNFSPRTIQASEFIDEHFQGGQI